MVICPQVLHAGASDCMFFAAAFTASIPAGAAAVAAACCSFCAGAGAAAGAVTRMLLNSQQTLLKAHHIVSPQK